MVILLVLLHLADSVLTWYGISQGLAEERNATAVLMMKEFGLVRGIILHKLIFITGILIIFFIFYKMERSWSYFFAKIFLVVSTIMGTYVVCEWVYLLFTV